LKENKPTFSFSTSSYRLQNYAVRVSQFVPIQNFKAVFSMRLKFPMESGRTVGLCMRASDCPK